jgi:ATP phosphoribosyltransferase regulatory subunit
MTAGEREVVQAGVELIGASGPIADAEVLALLVESLERCGLRLENMTIHVGHVGVVRRFFAPLEEEPRSLVLSALRAGDLVGAFRRAQEAGMTPEDTSRAHTALGVVGRGIEQLQGHDVDELRQVIHLARERWAGSVKLWGVPNIGLVPALPYYTGIVFEALHPDVGVIASGGRYDLLIGAYGAPRPATGFAIDVLRLHRALFAEGWRPANVRPLVTLRPVGDERMTMRCAASLRAAGLSVAIGDVAETAGIALVAAAVVDERRVKLGDGRTLDATTLASELAT